MKKKLRLSTALDGGGGSLTGSDSNDHKDNYNYGPADDYDDLPF